MAQITKSRSKLYPHSFFFNFVLMVVIGKGGEGGGTLVDWKRKGRNVRNNLIKYSKANLFPMLKIKEI